MNIKEQIKEKYNFGYFLSNGFKITKLEKNEVIIEYKVKESGLNPYNIVHGGILFSLCDFASGALSLMNGHLPITTSDNINFLNVAKCKKIKCKCNILKEGNNIGYYDAKIYDENDILLTTGSINMYLKKIDK